MYPGWVPGWDQSRTSIAWTRASIKEPRASIMEPELIIFINLLLNRRFGSFSAKTSKISKTGNFITFHVFREITAPRTLNNPNIKG